MVPATSSPCRPRMRHGPPRHEAWGMKFECRKTWTKCEIRMSSHTTGIQYTAVRGSILRTPHVPLTCRSRTAKMRRVAFVGEHAPIRAPGEKFPRLRQGLGSWLIPWPSPFRQSSDSGPISISSKNGYLKPFPTEVNSSLSYSFLPVRIPLFDMTLCFLTFQLFHARAGRILSFLSSTAFM